MENIAEWIWVLEGEGKWENTEVNFAHVKFEVFLRISSKDIKGWNKLQEGCGTMASSHCPLISSRSKVGWNILAEREGRRYSKDG